MSLFNPVLRWIDSIQLIYSYHKNTFLWSVVILFALTAVWSKLAYDRFRSKKAFWLLGYYMIFIFTVTNLFRTPEPWFQIKPVPGWSYYEIIRTANNGFLFENLANILIFIPLGIIAGFIFSKKKALLLIISKTVSIELIQLIFRTGFFEWDDIFNNFLGGLIGVEIMIMIHHILYRDADFSSRL